MSATATYTMAELRGETQHGGLWSSYGNPMPMAGRFNPQDPTGAAGSSHLVRPRSQMDYPPYPGRPGEEQTESPYDRYPAPPPPPPHPSMNIPSINSLKRPYSQMESGGAAPYTEMVQDLRDEYKPPNHDQKLLSFKKVGDKHTIVDAKGRIHEIEIDAQLHGMFFLSEFPSTTGDGSVLSAELTCYRRNLFQISGSICFPQIPLSVLLESGETSLIKNMEVTISAIESVDGHPVRLIVIPWKTPPPNSPETSNAPDQEPPTLPLIPPPDDEEDNGGDHYAIYPIGWRRLQFRIATANNGRRKELQQHFVLHLKLHGTLANGQKLVLSELTTAPIVVRGRSPRNFQARKEIPLLGSSAGSRGQTLVETGHGIVAQAVILNKPPYDSRPRISSLDVPRGAFTFTAPKQLPQSPMQMRSNSYPTQWNPPQVSMPHAPGSATYPTSSIPQDPYPKMPLSGAPGFTTEPQELPMQPTTMGPPMTMPLASHDPHHPQPAPIRTQFATYTSAPPPHHLSLPTATVSPDSALAVPRYIGDTNPRPTKSPRHASHQSVASSISNETASGEYRYGPPAAQPPAPAAGGYAPASGPAPSDVHHSAVLPPPGQAQQTPGQQAPAQTSPYGTTTTGTTGQPQDGAAGSSAPQSASSATAQPGQTTPQQTPQQPPSHQAGGHQSPHQPHHQSSNPPPPPSRYYDAGAPNAWSNTTTGGAAAQNSGAAPGEQGNNSAGADRPYGYPAPPAVKTDGAATAQTAANGGGYGYPAWNAA